MNINDFGHHSFVRVKGLIERIEEELDIRPLLGIGMKKKTVYRCQFCGEWTDGLTSYAGFISCGNCRIEGTRIERNLKRVNDIEKEVFGES